MTVQQIYQVLNDITHEYVGDTASIQEDLSNLVDVGTAVFSVTNVDNYVKSLIDKVGKVISVSREYKAPYPNILRDSWEYGSVLQKIRTTIPEAEANPSWSLVTGQTPNQFEFKAPVAYQKFYNHKETYEIWMSFTEMQIKESFNSRGEMMAFISMIENSIRTSQTIKNTQLAQRAINRFLAEKILAQNGIIHLLTEYHTAYPDDSSLTADRAIYSPEFLRYAAMQMMMYKKRLNYASVNFTTGTIPVFTPDEYLKFIVNDEFAKAINVFMTADTYHDQMVALSGYETIPFWQSFNQTYAFADTTNINVTLGNSRDLNKS